MKDTQTIQYHGLPLLAALLVLGLGIEGVRLRWLDSSEFSAVVQVFGGLIAAFYGASAAIYLQRKISNADAAKKTVDAANQAIVSLIGKLETLKIIETQSLNPERDSPARLMTVLPILAPSSVLEVPYGELAPILTVTDASLTLEIAKIEQEFAAIYLLIDRRNALHTRAQEVLGSTPFGAGGTITLGDMRRLLGEMLWTQLTSVTDQLYESVDGAIPSTARLIEKLSRAVKAQYKGHAVISYTPLLTPSRKGGQ